MTRLALLLATVGCIGYFPIAPGTIGSAGGLLVFALLLPLRSPLAEVAVILGLGAAGVWASQVAARHLGGEDPGPVVIDEVVGMLVTLAFVPAGWGVALAGFFLFRIFDILKPYPASRFERLPGGWGVMADDVMAGIYANLGLRLLMVLAPGPLAAVDGVVRGWLP
jgi:phosphatidylglycerophosphatase A